MRPARDKTLMSNDLGMRAGWNLKVSEKVSFGGVWTSGTIEGLRQMYIQILKCCSMSLISHLKDVVSQSHRGNLLSFHHYRPPPSLIWACMHATPHTLWTNIVSRALGLSPCFYDCGWQLNLILWAQPPLESPETGAEWNLTQGKPDSSAFLEYSSPWSVVIVAPSFLSPSSFLFLFTSFLYNPLLCGAPGCHTPRHRPGLWRFPSWQSVDCRGRVPFVVKRCSSSECAEPFL